MEAGDPEPRKHRNATVDRSETRNGFGAQRQYTGSFLALGWIEARVAGFKHYCS